MHLTQTVKSASFKLTLAYVVLFAASIAVLAILTYSLVSAQMKREFYSHIANETKALVMEFNAGGTKKLLDAMEVRQRVYMADGLNYGLFAEDGGRLFGKMPLVGCKSGWQEIEGPPDGDEPPGEKERLGVIVTPLSGGQCLLVGDDLGAIDNFEAGIFKTFGWICAVSLTLAVVGGILLSTNFLRRIEVVNKTAEAIIGGDLKRRIPRRGAPDDLDRLTTTLNRMLDRICELMESHRHLSDNVAHDLRAPMSRLRLLLDEARSKEFSRAGVQVVLDQAVEEIDGVLDTFAAILRIAQIENGTRRAGFRTCDLTAIVNDVTDSFAPTLEEDGHVVSVAIEPGVSVLGDPELITLALANVMENCVIHTPRDAMVSVSLVASGMEAIVSISDDGRGIPGGTHGRIFERFYRVDHSRSVSGSGLGLSIVAAIAELHGARLDASDNKPGLRVDLKFQLAA